MNRFRLLPPREGDAFTNMAVDEAVLRTVGRGDSPTTLRFYRWNPSAVSIGYFQSLEHEVDVGRADELGIDVVRRMTGGGSVFHDRDGEVTYSFVSPPETVPEDVMDSFKRVCSGVAEGLGILGLTTKYSEVNDVEVGGKKISGSAQTRRYGGFLQHGTILIDPDTRKMFDVLKVSKEKLKDKLVPSSDRRVTCISRELGEKPGFQEVESNMVRGFERIFDASFFPGDLTPEEERLAEGLKKKYGSEEWTRRR